MTTRRTSIAIAGLAAALCAAAAPALAQSVGTAAAVNPAATGTPPGAVARSISIGADVVHDERIKTTGKGAVQVLFVDRTALTIGPNSDLTIDEFVYNPNAGTGTFVATLTRGSLRFIGGKISHNSGATINAPSATIGVRGAVVGISYTPSSSGTSGTVGASVYYGTASVNAGGTTYTVPAGQQFVATITNTSGSGGTGSGGGVTVSNAQVVPVSTVQTGSSTTASDTGGSTGGDNGNQGGDNSGTQGGGQQNGGEQAADNTPEIPVFIDDVVEVGQEPRSPPPPPASPPEPQPAEKPTPPEEPEG